MRLSQPIHRLKRRARLLSRSDALPLHVALDRIAREEGFPSWSLLAARHAEWRAGSRLLSRLDPGDLLLIAGRPGQGKTRLGIRLAVDAVRAGRHAVIFTLEYHRDQVLDCIRSMGEDPRRLGDRLSIDDADEIDADHIVARSDTAAPGTLILIDYLQLLDQRRDSASLSDQVTTLRTLARQRDLILVFLSQVHRSFAASGRSMPRLSDLKLPNPVDLGAFTRSCFVHQGRMTFGTVRHRA
ncbi:MAG: DNA helicase [Gemmatimonadota bacterium]